MTDDRATDTARPRRRWLGVTVLLGGVAAVAWWRQARRDPALVERTQARLITHPVAPATRDAETTTVATPPDLLPPSDPVALRSALEPDALPSPVRNPVGPSAAIPPRPQSSEPFSPDLRGVRVG